MSRPATHDSIIAIVLTVACLVSGSGGAREPRSGDDAKGSHPLAGRSGSLADLLEMPDWETPASPPPGVSEDALSAADSPASAPETRPEGGRVKLAPEPLVTSRPAVHETPLDFQSLIDKRNAIVDGCDLFSTMEEVFAAEAVLAQHWRVQQAASAELNAAIVARNQVYALGKAGQHHRGGADGRVRNAEGSLRNAVAASEAQVRVLAPLYERITPHFGPWLQTYREMRARLKPDRRDPDRAAVLAALEAGTTRRNDFYEGHVLAALSQAYDGNAEAANKHLAAACVGYARLRLFFSLLGPDCCEAYLLLGKPEMVKDWVAAVKKMESGKRQTALLCWLVANTALEAGKANEAKIFFDRALAKAGLHKADEGGSQPEPLLGDAAFFYVTAPNEKLRNLEKARELLAKAPEASEHWRVLRARVALLAAEGRQAEAQAALDACRARAPAVLDESLTELVTDSRP